MAMNLFLNKIKQMREDYLSSDIGGSMIIVGELHTLIEVTEVKIQNNIKHYNGDRERATDDFMLDNWIRTIEDYYLIFKQMDSIDDFTKKQFRILVNEIQSIKI